MSCVDKAKSYGRVTVAYLTITCLVLIFVVKTSYSSSTRFQFPVLRGFSSSSSAITNVDVVEDELESALRRASMGKKKKRVIIAFANKAYAEEDGMLDIFVESFREGVDTEWLLPHLLLVAVDQTAFDRCNHHLLRGRIHCFKLVTEGVDFSGEQLFMSDAFIRMMWRRTLFLGDVLRRGYSFIFTDTDVMWLRNPFTQLGEEGDLQISCDRFNGRAWNTTNPINTGFYFARSSNKTITLFDMWYSERNNSVGMKEQDVLENMISSGILEELGVKVRNISFVYSSITFTRLHSISG
ncbi:hypothetical protein H6P81_005422 [Aristolochia fimbriata]|uniref:Nucleotide-diphospho-sugar transferase domain-containing protein n=1 Tax=Aristolochia fimbriata TaxID=158543 RepID=A0AAV7EUY0_ARIFI|nr:hypothetical protein H6P81_005422 [Aristolochia fimbriata]